jgi:hypothetical protein
MEIILGTSILHNTRTHNSETMNKKILAIKLNFISIKCNAKIKLKIVSYNEKNVDKSLNKGAFNGKKNK